MPGHASSNSTDPACSAARPRTAACAEVRADAAGRSCIVPCHTFAGVSSLAVCRAIIIYSSVLTTRTPDAGPVRRDHRVACAISDNVKLNAEPFETLTYPLANTPSMLANPAAKHHRVDAREDRSHGAELTPSAIDEVVDRLHRIGCGCYLQLAHRPPALRSDAVPSAGLPHIISVSSARHPAFSIRSLIATHKLQKIPPIFMTIRRREER